MVKGKGDPIVPPYRRHKEHISLKGKDDAGGSFKKGGSQALA